MRDTKDERHGRRGDNYAAQSILTDMKVRWCNGTAAVIRTYPDGAATNCVFLLKAILDF